jgi:hypothetical protein
MFYFLKKNLIIDDKNFGSLKATIFILVPSYLKREFCIRHHPQYISTAPPVKIHPQMGIKIAIQMPIPIEATITPNFHFKVLLFLLHKLITSHSIPLSLYAGV